MEFWTVEQCCDILDSQRVPVTESERVKGRYPYYGANGVQDHVADFLFDDELVLVAEDGGNFGSTTKPIAYRVSGKCWVNNHAHVLKPHEDVNVDYLCYALMYYPVGNMVNGTTRKKLNQADLRKMKVPVRPVEAQEDIVRNIQNTETAIENRKRVLALLDELVKSRFVEMFGDASKNPHNYRMGVMVDLCDAIVDCPHSTPQEYVADRTHPAIRTTEIHNGQIEWSTMRYVSESEYQQRVVRLIPQAGDIVYGREGSWGEAVILPKGYQFCLGQRVMLLRPKVGVCLPEFLWQQIRSPYVYAQAKAKNVGATVGHVNVADIKNFSVLIPPLEEQQNFAAFVHQVDATKAAAREEIAALETLRGKMMQEFFGVRAGVRAEG